MAVRYICGFLGILMAALLPAAAEEYAPSRIKPIQEEPMTQSYLYTKRRGESLAIPSPAPFRAAYTVDSEALGVPLAAPADIFVQDQKTVYIVDKGNHAIICTDARFNVQRVIRSFTFNGKTETFQAPEGVYATQDKIYVADTGNQRLVVLHQDLTCAAVITQPQMDAMADNLVFAPRKVAVDSAGRIYTVVRGAYEGIMELYEDGSFGGYVGSIPVKVDPLLVLWKSIMSKEQRAKLASFVPVEYSNLALAEERFLYTVAVSAQGQNAIRKLNYAGEDILIRYGLEDTGVSGDVLEEDAKQVNSFVDICAAEDGLFYALDATFGRIFGYDAQGNLLFIYGGKNTGQTGTFEEAAALDVLDKWICVADAGTASITLFEKTEYAALVLEGIALYEEDKYPESIAVWEDVLQYNSHFILAYSKIGQALYQMGDYRQALSYFRQAADQPNYSRAFKEWRDEAVKSHFTLVACVLVGAILLLVVLCRAAARLRQTYPPRKGGKRESLGYAFHVICHPLDGFWDLKYEKRGRAWVSTLFIILTVATFALERSLTGFSLSKTVGQPLDWIYELKFVLVPLALFLVANVAITTLMEGKGTFRELYTAAGYTLLPLILIRIPATLLSNIMTQEESMYLHLLNALSVIWVAVLIFSALLCTHEYTAGKTVATILLTAVSMVIICFICVLFFSLFTELVGCVYTIMEELRFR